MLKEILKILDGKKAEDITAINIEGISILSDYFLLATGNSSTQVKALAEEIDSKLSRIGVEPLRVEGVQSASWIIMDYGGVVVHIFYRETRSFYNLERLWGDGKFIDLDDLRENKDENKR